MPRVHNYSDLSGLEAELELEMDDEFEQEDELNDELEALNEFESPNDEFESHDEFEGIEDEYAASDEFEYGQDNASTYAQRFYELGQQEFESEAEGEQAVDDLMNEMEQEFFIGKIRKGWKKLKKRGVGKLVQKGLKIASGVFPATKVLQGVTDLAKGNLTGILKNGVMTALSAHPGGAATMAALKALGFELGAPPENNQEAWDNYVAAARESYEYLLENLTPNADNPLEASRLAYKAFNRGVQKTANTRPGAFRNYSSGFRAGRPSNGARTIRVRAGERVIVKVDTGGKVLVKNS